MQVGSEIAFLALAQHRGHHPVADHKTANVLAFGLLDELLYQDVGVELAERLYDAFGGLVGLAQHHALALGPFQEFDNHRRAIEKFENVTCLAGPVGKDSDRQTYALAREELQAAQLVAGPGDRHRFVERIDAHDLELAQNGGSEECDRCSYSGNNRFVAFDLVALIEDRRAVGRDVYVALADGRSRPSRGRVLPPPPEAAGANRDRDFGTTRRFS